MGRFELPLIWLCLMVFVAPSLAADYTKPGGNRYAMRLKFGTGLFGPSAAVNLAATRTVKYTEAGTKIVFYKMIGLRMDPGSSCSVYAASFTVLITP